MAAWCSANHVALEQFKYWTRKLKKVDPSNAATAATNFIPITITEAPATPPPSPLILQIGAANISLHRGFDPQLLRETVEALSRSC